MELQGKVAILTGVGGDGQIGQAVARALAGEGAKLILVARNAERLQARADEIKGLGHEVLAVPADLTREEDVDRVVRQAMDRFGRIDILVNLAGGLTKYKGIEEHTLDDWNSELGNNLLSAFLLSKAAFGPMREGGGGRIINFAVGRPTPGQNGGLQLRQGGRGGADPHPRPGRAEAQHHGQRRGARACRYKEQRGWDETEARRPGQMADA